MEKARAAAARAGTKGVPRRDREEQILAVATEEFGRHGYTGVSMAALARRIGVTKPLLYQYFGSKDGLYTTCLARVGEPLATAVRAAMHRPAAEPATPIAVLRAVFATLEGRPGAWFLLYDQSLPAGSAPYETARRYRDAIDELAAGGAQDVLRAGNIEDPLDADLLKRLWNTLVGQSVVWWARHPEESAASMGERCARILQAVRFGGPAGGEGERRHDGGERRHDGGERHRGGGEG
ncbi:TetR/AcrR family transcriptional regulator [Streptomyces sp. SCSIO ZS0520]|uniref:TetR/AcrR family transcriptional regulator n=1 Tax=Streptomyces sp. SCSIO ZS0520 TaxID=2892996 RepID=UPI0021D9A733|nr:TetR/AcrR family transcriptional regulator [Streptomyces sp. SCSIO ZS0520]